MSINWVMVSPEQDGFVLLPNERTLFRSPPRISLALSTPNSFPGATPWTVSSETGKVYITNQRIIYLPASPTPQLKNFSCPILNLQDTCVRAPFFGANYWTAVVRPVAGGGIPSTHPYVELRMTFREGGAYDYHTVFEQLKERLHHAVSIAREEGRPIGSTSSGLAPADLLNVHLEQLPAYEPAGVGSQPTQTQDRNTGRPPAAQQNTERGVRDQRTTAEPEREAFTPPNEPPPGYEEAQAQAVGADLDQRTREEACKQS